MRIEKVKDGIKFTVKVQPKSSRAEIAGIQGEYLKVKVTAAPTRGEANKECIKVLSSWLGVKASQVEIERGKTSRIKRVKVKGDSEKLIHNFNINI